MAISYNMPIKDILMEMCIIKMDLRILELMVLPIIILIRIVIKDIIVCCSRKNSSVLMTVPNMKRQGKWGIIRFMIVELFVLD